MTEQNRFGVCKDLYIYTSSYKTNNKHDILFIT